MDREHIEKINKLIELEDIARDRYLNKVDWDITEWLYDDELKLYRQLFREVNEYCICGEENCDCTE